MQTQHPERIVAVWLHSGTAFGTWSEGEIEAPTIPDATSGVPVLAEIRARKPQHEPFGGLGWVGGDAAPIEHRAPS